MRWLLRFRKLDMTQPEQRQALVDTFINAIYLYDDKVLITFNYKEGTETVALGEAVKAEKRLDMSARGAPYIERQIVRFGVLFCYVTPKNRGLHGRDFRQQILQGAKLLENVCRILHQVSRARRSCAFTSGSAFFRSSSKAVIEMVGSPSVGTACGLGVSCLA